MLVIILLKALVRSTKNKLWLSKAYFRRCPVLRRARTFLYSTAQINVFFRRAKTSRTEHLWKACCTPQRGFSTTSKTKRRSVDVIFLCKLGKFEKCFPVNWSIIIEYIHKHYIKQISKNTELLCNVKKVLLITGNWEIDLK